MIKTFLKNTQYNPINEKVKTQEELFKEVYNKAMALYEVKGFLRVTDDENLSKMAKDFEKVINEFEKFSKKYDLDKKYW